MSALEAKVPPALLTALFAAAIWFLPRTLEPCAAPSFTGGAFVAAGLGMNAWPKLLFRRADTSVSPIRPALASALVTDGPYRFSRNPMYLGYAIALLGWSTGLAQPWGLLAVAFFVAYITRFQILPEERYLSSRFPAQYAAYSRAVRRWT